MGRWILAIDTATAVASVALVEDCASSKHKTRALHAASVRSHSHHEDLASLVARLLRDGSISPSEVSRVVVGAGPGSFTGLRIGYSFARGVALSLGIPLHGVSSLHGAAYEFRREAEAIAPLLDAGRGEVFMAVYRASGDSLTEVAKPAIVPRATMGAFISEVLGPITPILVELEDRSSSNRVASEIAVGLAHIWSSDRRTESLPMDIEPEYIRGVAAKTIAQRRGEHST
ncbi:MAG: hypothetical protein RL417_479 [Pseudomonadota bacterium]|jgi:tRNA threonylcarbamoyladenosine biosynthesis protein TsaB